MTVTDDDPLQYALSEQVHEEIFREMIIPHELVGEPQRQPVVLLLGGQTGAGKSRTKAALANALAIHGGAVDFGTDSLRVYHPMYGQLLRTDERRNNFYTDHDARRWVDKAVSYAAAQRFNVVFDSTLSRPASASAITARFRAEDYRMEAAFVAVPAALSKLGILQRYQAQLEVRGHGRVTLLSAHDDSYAGVLDTADLIDNSRLVDAVHVYRRGGELLYTNQLDADRNWQHPPETRHVIETERHRQWSNAEIKQFAADARDLAERMDPKWRPDITAAVRAAEPNIGKIAATQAEQNSVQAIQPPHLRSHERGEETRRDDLSR